MEEGIVENPKKIVANPDVIAALVGPAILEPITLTHIREIIKELSTYINILRIAKNILFLSIYYLIFF
jgi:hypothetical protein